MVLGTEHHVFGRQVGGALSRLGDELSDTTMQLLSANGIECSITSPTVFQGMNIEFSSPSPALAVPIRMAAGQVDIIVAVDGERLAHKRI
jgi:CheY-specific phosphatase CheX